MKRGLFILFEGVDRSGKTTQCARLVKLLNAEGRVAEGIHFPDRGTPTGAIINDYLQRKIELEDHAVHLLFSANRWEKKRMIEEKLHDGVTLVCDRYSFSGVAFSAAKDNMSLDWCRQAEVGLPKPDVMFFLHSHGSHVQDREGFGDERYETSTFQQKVLHQYSQLIGREWFCIDARQSVDAVHSDIMKILTPLLDSHLHPLSHLSEQF